MVVLHRSAALSIASAVPSDQGDTVRRWAGDAVDDEVDPLGEEAHEVTDLRVLRVRSG